MEDGVASGALLIGDRGWALEDFGGVYNRLADVAAQPDLAGVPEDDPTADPSREPRRTAPDMVRADAGASGESAEGNGEQCVEAVPARADRRTVRHAADDRDDRTRRGPRVLEQHGRVVYKSTSGARSIVQELVDGDMDRLPSVTRCATQFQAYVPGIDVRVHTIANGCVFATVIDSDRVDYRYAHHEGGSASMYATSLDDELSARCLALAEQLDLAFAGIDLRITPDGEAYCLEVNPSPAYSAFEAETGQTISAGLAAYLAGLHGHG